MKKYSFTIFFVLIYFLSFAQILDPVHWTYTAKHLSGNNYELTFTAKIDEGFHIFSQSLPENATPMPTVISFSETKDFELVGKTVESGKWSEMEDWDKTKLKIFEGEATFKQNIKMINKNNIVKGTISFMKCDHEKCLPPEDIDYEIKLLF